MKWKDWGMVAAVQGALAVFWTWPTALSPATVVPGAERTDLWDSLWSFWYVHEQISHGKLPLHADGLLNHPDGGLLWVADPLNALLMLPLLAVASLPLAWSLLVLLHQVFAGVAAYGLCRELSGSDRAAWVGSVAYGSAPLMLSHIHNGASEAVGMGWLAAAAWALCRVRSGVGGVGLAGLLVGLCAIGQWYAGLSVGLLTLLLAADCGLAGDGAASRRLLLSLALGLAVAAPVAALSLWASTTEGNLVGIKAAKELNSVRRTIGPADPVGFFVGGDYRSPDFRELSRYGEEYIHCTYLGWAAILAALVGLTSPQRRRGGLVWLVVLGVGMILAMGPVLARFGEPVILPGRRAIPLPYLLLEKLPGFSSLSLLWRLSQLSVLALAVLATKGIAGHRWERWLAPLFVVAFVAEVRWLSPMAGKPDHTRIEEEAPLIALRDAPEGAVMNFPIAGGRAYLYEQTVHEKALAGTLNFPNNKASMAVWRAALRNKDAGPEQLRAELRQAAQAVGVRYLVVHVDPMARPDQHDIAVRAIKEAFTPLSEIPSLKVYALW
jgi:hypothetical protein